MLAYSLHMENKYCTSIAIEPVPKRRRGGEKRDSVH